MNPINDISKHEFAVATLLYGERHLFNAIVLGHSMKVRSRGYRSILMAVGNFEQEQLAVLRRFWDEVIVFSDIKESVGSGLQFDVRCNKFYAYTLDTFKKVLVLDADMVVADNLEEVFQITTPATTALPAEVAWTCNVPLTAEHVITKDGWLRINPAVFLLEPSQQEFEDIIEAISEKHAAQEPVYHPVFLIKYFMGSWYSISHEYNFRPQFVAYGDTKAYGVHPNTKPCRLIHYNSGLEPADIYFYSQDFVTAKELMPINQRELLERVIDWPRLPDITTKQSSKDRLLGMYKLWFSYADQAIDQIANSTHSAVLFQLRPARESDPQILLKQLSDNQARITKRNLLRLSRNNRQKIEVTETSHVTRLPFNG